MSFKYLDPTGVGYFWYKVKSLVSTKYTKPDAGIPKSDLESSVQTTLTNADTVVTNFSNKIDKVNGATAGNIAILNATGSITDGNTSIQNVELNVDTNGHTYVDLGLPSGTLWATCNVGATNPEDYGDYYAWGETQTKQEYSWNTYQHGSSNSNITKYNITDGKTELEPDDDVCHIVMGGDWRMPTEVQCRELIANTTYTWTTTNGVTGILLTSTVNNNTLFIPASGYINNTSITDLTIQSCIWSSNLYIHETYGIMGVSELSYRETGSLIVINNDRCKGYPCRGIINKSGIQFKQGKTIMPVKTTASAVEFPDGETALSKVSDLEENKVDKVSGKSLSTNDYTTEDKTKLSNIASGAQVNVLETVKVNDNPLTITNKSVNIDLSNYAQKNGSYSGMTVGAAEDLVSAESVASEFTSRITGGSTAVGKGGTALVDKIKGRTLVWNQLVKNPNFANNSLNGWTTRSGPTFSFDNRVLTITGINGSLYLKQEQSITLGHKYYVSMKVGFYNETVSSTLYNLFIFDGSNGVQTVFQAPVANSLDKYSVVIAATKGGYQFGFSTYPIPPGATLKIDCDYGINIIDLTLMFGAGNEPATAAEFEALYPLPYYAYHPGKFINNGLQSEYDLTWNQLVNNGDFSNSSTGWSATGAASLSVSSKVASITTTGQYGVVTRPVTIVDGHKFYFAFSAKASSTTLTFRGGVGDSGYFGSEGLMIPITVSSTDETRRFSTVGTFKKNASASAQNFVLFMDISSSVHGTISVSNVVLYDLTMMFGAGNEPATTKEFEAMFPNDYYAYDAGTQQHFSFPQFKTKIETVGFNQWDEEWENGFYESTNGAKKAQANTWRNKKPVRILPNTTYYATYPLYRWYYDADMNFIQYAANGRALFTSPSNAYYLNFGQSAEPNGPTSSVCISLSDPSRNGTYEPYWRSELELGLGDIKVKSHNVWDEEVEVGSYNTANGEKLSSSAKLRSKNKIPVVPGNYYYYKSPVSCNIFLFGEDGSTLVGLWTGSTNLDYDIDHPASSSFQVTWAMNTQSPYRIPSNAYYIAFSTFGSSYTNPSQLEGVFCINESSPYNGRYEPYGDGGVITITGGLKSAGTVYDEISGGKLIKRIGSVDLGTLRWSAISDASYPNRFQTVISGIAVTGNNLILRYINKGIGGYGDSINEDKSFDQASTTINVHDSSYSDAATYKAAMSGVPLYYELASPIEYELADAIPTAMRNDPYGTERRLPEDTAAIVIAPFRADITYSTNIKEAVQSLPQNYININSMQDFLAALGAQMGGTWTMRPADGKFDFTFTENEQPVL